MLVRKDISGLRDWVSGFFGLKILDLVVERLNLRIGFFAIIGAIYGGGQERSAWQLVHE